MKKRPPSPVILIISLSLVFLLPHTGRLWAQPPLTAEQLDSILGQTPLDPSTLPFAGAYFLASQSLVSNGFVGAPLPCLPANLVQQGCQIFIFPFPDDPGAYMVNDLGQEAANQPSGGTFKAAVSGARAQMALASDAPCQSLGLDDQGQPLGTLVVTNQLPSGAGFLSATNPCTAPAPDFPAGLAVYSVPGFSNLFLVWDIGYDYPTNTQPDNPNPQPQGQQYPDGSLWLSISNVGNQWATVFLNNAQTGTVYTLFSSQVLSPPPMPYLLPLTNWMVELHAAATSNVASVQVPILGRQALYLWACSGWVYGPENLWIQPLGGMSNGSLNANLWGTISGVTYEIQSASSPAGPWQTETMPLAVDGQDFTPFSVVAGSRPALFLRARSWADSENTGIPDWWWYKYVGFIGNPYALDPSGDGWSYIQDYQNGFVPGTTNTPPTPQGLAASYNRNSGVASVSWSPSPGPVTGYILEGQDIYGNTVDHNLPAGTTAYQEAVSVPNWALSYGPPQYRLQASYSCGASPWTGWVPIYEFDDYLGTGFDTLMRGPQGLPYFVGQDVPPNAATVRIVWEDPGSSNSDETFTVPATDFTNGVFAMPLSWVPTDTYLGDDWFFEFDDANGTVLRMVEPDLGLYTPGGFLGYVGDTGEPFIDGRQQLQQNLAFMLRAALADVPLSFYDTWPYSWTWPTNYAYAQAIDVNRQYWLFDTAPELLPFAENYLFANFAFSSNNVGTNGLFNTGVFYDPSYGAGVANTLTYVCPSDTTNFSALLSPAQSQWFWPAGINLSTDEYNEFGASTGPGGTSLATGVSNLFGLPFLSVKMAYNTGGPEQYTDLNAGHSTTQEADALYPETAQPALQTVGYYFYRPGTADPAPEYGNFASTNTTPLMIFGLGQAYTYQVQGYAIQKITNGDPTKLAYLGQYFDRALLMGTNGVTNGLLSPYGEFFPNLPGPTELITMTNYGVNECGTAVVHVVSLALDANHDGTMDLSRTGPDATDYYHPYVFWINNNFDRRHAIGSDQVEDDVAANDPNADCWFTPGVSTPDCEYRNSLGERVIPSERDLEDFARLWVCGVTSNLVSSLPPGVTGVLSLSTVGNPNTNNPTIDLFGAYDGMLDRNGGMGYLTNTLQSMYQTNPANATYVDRLGPGSNITVFSNGWVWRHFIWCGVKPGFGALTLTVQDAQSNVLAQTSQYIQVVDIKQMYERWTVGEDSRTPPASEPSLAPDGLTTPFQFPPSPRTNMTYILQVHDYNLPTWQKDRYAETAFKRLYWQGYQGRFGLFRWPIGNTNSMFAMNNSESNAWNSGAGLLNLLTKLNAQYPGQVYLMAHGFGAIAAGEALRLAHDSQVVNTYIAMQGAVPSEAYDGYAPSRPNPTYLTPDYYLPYYTNGGPYFFWAYGAGTYINYFNTNDYVLTNLWCLAENAKPDLVLSYRWGGSNFLYGLPPGAPLFIPEYTYEIFSYCSESWGNAIGAQPNLKGQFLGQTNIDLGATTNNYPFGGHLKDHNDQFLDDCALRWPFWYGVLKSMQLKP